MLVEVLCVCRRPPAWVSELCADYARRLKRSDELTFRYLNPGPDGVDSAVRRRDETSRIKAALKTGTHLVALDERGDAWSSVELAQRFAQWRERHKHLTLAIGGADGFDAALLDSAAESWSLSRLTLPHLFVQVVIAEQLYRAASILVGHPYHRP
ncbi:MAG: 23S rRNA (pseudouridine(1915)-N(3))-methyltransferase RlmH [Gammaproteobacteria bacterium]|nr:23S rRNA (pseudouridine(1915)-N(3))-methyltransferase RlmH [Gammaproteobacteria bacterium]